MTRRLLHDLARLFAIEADEVMVDQSALSHDAWAESERLYAEAAKIARREREAAK